MTDGSESRGRPAAAAGCSDPDDSRLGSGQAWRAFCRALEASAELVLADHVPDTPRHRAEGFRYLTRFLAAGLISCVSHDDPEYPVFGRMMDYTAPWGLDNPDCLYLYAPLTGGEVYRVEGLRGSAHHIDFQVNHGHYANGDIRSWGTISSMDGDALACDEEGRFTLVIGGEPRSRNWLPSAPDAEFLLVRQYFDDWERERPADLLIEREGEVLPIAPPRTDQVADQLEKLTRWLEKGGRLWERMSMGFLAMEPNSLIVHRPDAAGERSGMRGLAYGLGHFACRPDEAVIVEFEVPSCRHWGVALANWYWECVEFGSRQSSINRAQATIDADGRFRGVIAHTDPGVPNWLDPGGNEEGTITARFLQADRAPVPELRRVRLAELRDALPASTPDVRPEERRERLLRRRLSVLRRYRR